MTESADVDVCEPIDGQVHITGDHDKGEWIIVGGMTTLDVVDYR